MLTATSREDHEGDAIIRETVPSSSESLREPRIYIIVVNWNDWRDTIECLESVFRLHYSNFRVIVCDNNSSDGSIEQIFRWAEGTVLAGCTNPVLLPLTSPPVLKPVPHCRFDAPPRNGNGGCEESLILIETGSNLGYAGGNNVGLRYALDCGNLDYAWLLNNDTVVSPDALGTLVRRLQECPDAGMCGSTLLYYNEPAKVQAMGGSVFNRWIARGGHIGMFCDANHLPSHEVVETKMKYVVGASALVSRQFLETIGLMDESYFLYFEEIDWATRAIGKFRLVYCPKSVVYHKDGATTGSRSSTKKSRIFSERLYTRNRLLFTRRFYPGALITVWSTVFASACLRLVTGRSAEAFALLRELFRAANVFGGVRGRSPDV